MLRTCVTESEPKEFCSNYLVIEKSVFSSNVYEKSEDIHYLSYSVSESKPKVTLLIWCLKKCWVNGIKLV